MKDSFRNLFLNFISQLKTTSNYTDLESEKCGNIFTASTSLSVYLVLKKEKQYSVYIYLLFRITVHFIFKFCALISPKIAQIKVLVCI